MAINKINLDGTEYSVGAKIKGAKKIETYNYFEDLDIYLPEMDYAFNYPLKPNTLYLYEAHSEDIDIYMTGYFITNRADDDGIIRYETTSYNSNYCQDLEFLYSYFCTPYCERNGSSSLKFVFSNINPEYISEISARLGDSFSVFLYELPITLEEENE